MQLSNLQEPGAESPENNPEISKTTVSPTASSDGINSNNENNKKSDSNVKNSDAGKFSDCNSEDESVIDVSGQNVEFPLLRKAEDSLNGLYVYRNVFNLIPKSIGDLRRLRTLKFFGNEINLFPGEFGNLEGLECLQVKISSPGFNNGLSLNKLKGLKELELTKVPRRASGLTILSEISGLKCLTKLSVCHFSIRYLPPEIGCLENLEHLDLSFNKIKILPTEVTYLSSLISLKVANNKLVELPSGLSSLLKLETLDLSNNRLTSLGSLELGLMHKLQTLNLQYNNLLSYCQIPSWICCNLEGNGKDSSNDDFISSLVEMDVYETSIQETDGSISYNGSCRTSSSMLTGPPSSSRCFSPRKRSKRWKRQQHILQQKARQERLNNSRKWKCENIAEGLIVDAERAEKLTNPDSLNSDTTTEGATNIVGLDDDKKLLNTEAESENISDNVEEEKPSQEKGFHVENCVYADLESNTSESKCIQHDGVSGEEDKGSPLGKSTATSKSKRHCDRDLDNPKPCKYRKPTEDSSSLSHKYNTTSICSFEDYLPDGFYDAGRDRPFMTLLNYEQILHLDSREVIVLDRERDEELDAVTLSAQALVYHLKQLHGLDKDGNQVPIDNLQIASLLALFVSDHFGGSDRSAIIERTRKAVSGSNYRKPFVCTCSTGNADSISTSTKQTIDGLEDIILADLCEKSLRTIKRRRNSIIVPVGSLQFGICRHRALLMKYLCDRMEPPIPCELVRGYLDFMPHAWNVIPVKRGDRWVRMIADACHPHDIREESDLEYFCRYIPLSRINTYTSPGSSLDPECSFPSLSTSDEIGIENATSSSIIRCTLGSVEAAAKVRTLVVSKTSAETIRSFEYSCLGEVRMLGALKHSCIVELYGHQISSKWVPSDDGDLGHRVLQSAILMEYVKGGPLKSHIEKLSESGQKHLPMDLALCVARDVASALAELHLKHIIHRDIKSENILIDFDGKSAGENPVVKLCDFDRAVPLRSPLHTCCIGHIGIPPPDVCVGTPRWMAPEVLLAMHEHITYGLEVDIWSYGCLLFELLTLQIPYTGLSELEIHDHLLIGKRPRLSDELEILGSFDEDGVSEFPTELDLPEGDIETLRFLLEVFRRCTEKNPTDRPTAGDLIEMFMSHTTSTFPASTTT